jgi:N-acyl amino acid synthase of PEP-CTERM/exosortase system
MEAQTRVINFHASSAFSERHAWAKKRHIFSAEIGMTNAIGRAPHAGLENPTRLPGADIVPKGALELADQSATWNSENESLFDRYNRDFCCMLAEGPTLLRQAYEIRYQVYCVENHFEDAKEHPECFETDEYDARSAHSILTFRQTGEAIGTVRLVLPDERTPPSFSMKQILDYYDSDVPFPLDRTAEVSRFSISKQSRPRKDGAIEMRIPLANRAALRRAEPLMSLGLIQGLIRMSALHRITHWCAVMEPQLLRMLSAMGIHFQPVGPLLEYHGPRQLCFCEISSVLKTVRRERPSFWKIITDSGNL